MFIIEFGGKNRVFATLDAAKAFASRVFDTTGIVVAIVAAA